MDQPPSPFWQYWAHLATAAALAFGALIYRGQVKRIDDMEDQLAETVSREDLERYMDNMREERRDMHQENQKLISDLTARIDAILHARH